MKFRINAYITNSGVPSTGLVPLITIINRTDGTTEQTNVEMIEVGDGFYEYILTNLQVFKDYLFSIDGTATLSDSDRYMASSWSGITWLTDNVNRSTGGYSGVNDLDVTKIKRSLENTFKEVLEDNLVKSTLELKDNTGTISNELKEQMTEVMLELFTTFAEHLDERDAIINIKK